MMAHNCNQLQLLGSACRSDKRLFVRVGSPVGNPKLRSDSGGRGEYGASRGSRSHKGIDIQTEIGQSVFSPIDGVITRIGWANSTHRYVEISGQIVLKDLSGQMYQGEECRVRVMYVKPSANAKEGGLTRSGEKIGEADDLHRNGQYPQTVGQHVHVEIVVGDMNIDPEHIVPLSK